MAGSPIVVERRRLERPSAGVVLDDAARRVGLADPVEQVAEGLAVLGHPDRLERRAEQPDRVAVEDAGLGQGRREVERGLAAQAGEQPLRLLPGDDRLDGLDGERLEVDDVGDGGSVMIVAGFELTRIVRTPSARSARQACVPA